MRRHARGMPAGITTISAPVNAFFSPSLAGRYPVTFWMNKSMDQPHVVIGRLIQKKRTAAVEICDRSAVTPGVLTTS